MVRLNASASEDAWTDSFPRGAAVRLADLSDDPYPILAELREHEPVTFVTETGMWFLTRRDDVVAVLRDAKTFTTDAPRSTIRDIFGAHMMTTDGAVALRYKRRCLHAFRLDTLKDEMGQWVHTRTEELVGAAPDAEPFDLMESVASPLAIEAALRVLGLPLELAGQVAEWYAHFALALANFTGDPALRARGKDAAGAFADTVRPLLGGLSASDRGLLAQLAHETDDPLSVDEIVANSLIILFGGIETVESMIANTVWSVIVSGRWGEVADPESRAALIEEALRWQPAVQSITRHTIGPSVIRGIEIPSGSVVQCMIGGANRDPGHFESPDQFDPARTNASDHLSFGTGRHLCLGAHLARIEIDAALAILWGRWKSLEFEGGETPPMSGYEFRRPQRLWVVGG